MRTTSELREEILDAARAEFARYGLAGARIDRIAKNSNASKERLYAHFGDKQALFRHVVWTDAEEFFRSVEIQPDDVPSFVGDVFDLVQRQPEHLRMITWARLESLAMEPPESDTAPFHEHSLAAIREAQARGLVDQSWDPEDLLVMLFGLGFAWEHLPDAVASATDAVVVQRRRSAAVEAARRLIVPVSG